MLQLRDIAKIYKSKTGQEISALDGVSLDIEYGQMVFVVGKSGCGKSTLLNIIGGLDTYDRGELIIDGISTKEFSDVDFDYYRNKYIGFVFQEYNLLEEDNIEKNITLSQKLQKTPADKEKTNELLNKLGLEGFGGRMPDELSGGQKQRAAIARALIKSPEIILADEPTGALDSESGVQILDILKEISKEKLVIVVSHDKEYAAKYADRIIELSDGRIVSDTVKEDGAFVPAPAIQEKVTETAPDKENIPPIIQEKVRESVPDKENPPITAEQDALPVANTERTPTKHRKKSKGFAEKGSGLAVKEACKIGISGLKRRKIRLITSILLASVATFLFGMCSAFFIYDENKVILNSMYDSGMYFALAHKKVAEVDADGNISVSGANIKESDLDFLRKKFRKNTFMPMLNTYTKLHDNKQLTHLADLGKENMVFERRNWITGAMEINKEIADNFKFKLLSGTFPAADNEILVSEYIYMHFERFGHRNPATGIITEIKSYDDLVGKSFGTGTIDKLTKGFKIAGVLDTKLNKVKYKAVLEAEYPDGKDIMPDYNYALHSKLMSEIEECGHGFIYLNLGHHANRTNVIKSYENFKNTYNYARHGVSGRLKDLADTSYSGAYTPAISKMGAFPYRAIKDAETPVIEGFPFDVYWKNGIEKNTLSENEVVVPIESLQKVPSLKDNSPEQIIAKLEGGTLTDLMFDIEHFDFYKYVSKVEVVGAYTLEESTEYEYIPSVFVSNKIYSEVEVQFPTSDFVRVASALSGNRNEDMRFLNFTVRSDEKSNETVKYDIDNNVYVYDVFGASNNLSMLSWIFLGAGGLMAVFAGLMIFNYFAVSIGDKKKEIGILRALGARKLDIFNIYMSRGLLIALINSAVAIILTAIGITVLNNILKTEFLLYITIVSFNYLSVIMILVLSLLTMFLGSIFPIHRISKQSPAAAIKTL